MYCLALSAGCSVSQRLSTTQTQDCLTGAPTLLQLEIGPTDSCRSEGLKPSKVKFSSTIRIRTCFIRVTMREAANATITSRRLHLLWLTRAAHPVSAGAGPVALAAFGFAFVGRVTGPILGASYAGVVGEAKRKGVKCCLNDRFKFNSPAIILSTVLTAAATTTTSTIAPPTTTTIQQHAATVILVLTSQFAEKTLKQKGKKFI